MLAPCSAPCLLGPFLAPPLASVQRPMPGGGGALGRGRNANASGKSTASSEMGDGEEFDLSRN